MIETLFGYTADKSKPAHKRQPSAGDGSQYIRIIDAKKSQNLSILLKALNVTVEEVCDALVEGMTLAPHKSYIYGRTCKHLLVFLAEQLLVVSFFFFFLFFVF